MVSPIAFDLMLPTNLISSWVDARSESKIETCTYICWPVVGNPEWTRIWKISSVSLSDCNDCDTDFCWSETLSCRCNNTKFFPLADYWLTGCIETWYVNDPFPAVSLTTQRREIWMSGDGKFRTHRRRVRVSPALKLCCQPVLGHQGVYRSSDRKAWHRCPWLSVVLGARVLLQ